MLFYAQPNNQRDNGKKPTKKEKEKKRMAKASSSLFSTHRHFPALIRRNIPSAGTARLNIPGRPTCLIPFLVAPVACVGVPKLLEAAKRTVDDYIRSGMVVGLGSGCASRLAIEYLGRRLGEGVLKDIVGVPTSNFSAIEATKAGIHLNYYQDSLQIDFAFDDADVIEEGTLTAIIGRRKLEIHDSIIEEKSIMKSANKFAFIIAEKQYTRALDGSIPVLVKSGDWMYTAEAIDDLFLGDAEVWRRPTSGNADPLGGDFPMVTKEGYHILDVIFTSPILDLAKVGENLDQIDGVVDHGVIAGIPCTAIIAAKSGVLTVDNLS